MSGDTNTRETALDVIKRARTPLSCAEITERVLALGTSVQPQSIAPSITLWYNGAKNGWEHVHREKQGPRTFVYSYDAGRLPRAPLARPAKPRPLPVPVRVAPVPANVRNGVSKTNGNGHGPSVGSTTEMQPGVFAKVVFNEGGVVVAVDQNFGVIKGTYLS